MPMDRSRYPDNWDAIAKGIKDMAGWCCEHCGRPCRVPGDDELEFAEHIDESGWGSYYDAPGRFVLTTAHLDQDPGNNAISNLAALCAPCHLRHDAPYREANSMAKRERAGQLPLLGGAIDG